MAKQRKLLYPSDSDIFFDEMEQEMNKVNRKRKKINKEPPMPPEKLFLQFDPSRKEQFCKKNNSQPLSAQKSQWKPPIRMFSQPESVEPNIEMIPEKTNMNCKESMISKFNEDAMNVVPSYHLNCLVADRSKDREFTGEDLNSLTNFDPIENEHKVGLSNDVNGLVDQRSKNRAFTGEDVNSLTNFSYNDSVVKIGLSNDTNCSVDNISNDREFTRKDINSLTYFSHNENEVKVDSSNDINGSAANKSKDTEPTGNNVNSLTNFNRNESAVKIHSLSSDINCLITNISNDREFTEEHDEVISINSSQESVKPSSSDVGSISIDCDKNNGHKPLNEYLNETDEKVVLSNVNTKSKLIEELEENTVVRIDKKMDREVEENCLLSAGSNSDCHLIGNDKLNIQREISKMNTQKNKECGFLTDKKSHISFDKADTVSKEEAHKEEMCPEMEPQTIHNLIPISRETNVITVERSNFRTETTTNDEIANEFNSEYSKEILNNRTPCDNENRVEIFGDSLDEGNKLDAYSKKINTEIELKVNCSSPTLSQLSEIEEPKLVGKSDLTIIEKSNELGIQLGITENKAESLYALVSTIVQPQEYSRIRDPYNSTHEMEEKITNNEVGDIGDISCILSEPRSSPGGSSGVSGTSSNNDEEFPLKISNIVSNNNSDCKNTDVSINIHKLVGRTTNQDREIETDMHENCVRQSEGCTVKNNNTFEGKFPLNDIEDNENEKITENNPTNLEVDNALQEENIGVMYEEYSCLMISNSQLEEIENNYYESSNVVAKEVPNFSNYNHAKCNMPLQNGNKMFGYRNTVEENLKLNTLDDNTQNKIGSCCLSLSQNVQVSVPRVQWPKNMLEMRKKMRELTSEIDRLNALLLDFRREIWPQRHHNSRTEM